MNKTSTRAMNKFIKLSFLASNALILSLPLLAAENSQDGENVSNGDFSGTPHANSSWIGCTAINTVFSSSRNPTDYTNSNFASANLTNASFIDATLSGANFTNANLNYVSFVDALLDDADFTNSIITNTNMGKVVVRGFTKEQLYSTASYKNRDLTGIILANNNLKDWNFSGQNLTNAYFHLADLMGVDFTNSIITGAYIGHSDNFTKEQLYSTASYKNKDLTGVQFDDLKMNGWNFAGQNLTNASFSGTSLSNADFTDSIITGASLYFATDRGFKKEQFYSTLSYKNKDLTGVDLGDNDLAGWDFSGQNLTNVSFYASDLTDTNLTDSIITGASFWRASATLTEHQFYSTLSYKNKSLVGLNMKNNTLDGWDFSGQNLASTTFERANLVTANFSGANLTNVNFAYADLSGANFAGAIFNNTTLTGVDITNTDFRGANMESIIGTPSYKNTIWSDGTIQNFTMKSSSDSFSISKYVPLSGGESISAKITQDASISSRAQLTLETGAELEVTNNATLTVSNGSSIIINMDPEGSTSFAVASGSGLTFEKGAILKVNIEKAFRSSDLQIFTIMSWNENSLISGLNDFIIDETLFLSVNGEVYEGDWNYFIENNNFIISMQVPEPAACAAIFGALVLAFAVCRRRK